MEIGALVLASNGLGVGKIRSINGESAVVEYFESVAVRREQEVQLNDLKAVRLWPETRCYVRTEDEGGWRAGRIGQFRDGTYEVKLPNLEGLYAPPTDIFVRCARAIDDPTDVLAERVHETAYFSERRYPFVSALVKQRAATRGLAGLVSGRIELFPHQVEVIRRVLEDPIQRYLLADEVGLGKTIEAGAILRQFLLDSHRGQAVVLAPPLLQQQWVAELEQKFAVSDFGDRVEVVPVDEFLQSDLGNDYQFVVIDEAHHVAALAESSPDMRWERVRQLAHQADRLLLLSATPALHNEKSFLAMLHLLDPEVYQLTDLEQFRDRVERRQEIGRFLLSFTEDAPDYPLRRALKRLDQMFPEDRVLSNLSADLSASLESGDQDLRGSLIRQIRTYIAETYRLHQRLMRNRRSSVEETLSAGRGGANDVVEEHDIDPRTDRLHDLLDDWRIEAQALADQAPEEDAVALRNAFLGLFKCSGTWLQLFEDALTLRRGSAPTELLRTSLTRAEVEAIQTAAPIPDEEKLLDEMQQVLEQSAAGCDRIDLLRLMLERLLRREDAPKVVVFTSFTGVQQEIAGRLEESLGADTIARYGTHQTGTAAEEEIRRFRTEATCNVLVCDQAGEEGRNLQFADWLIHFDLPLSPNRLEQRIGRLDRIGRTSGMKSRVLAGPEVEHSMHEAWLALLREGFGVFRRSIASLQFFVDAQLPDIEASLFKRGAQGLKQRIPRVTEEIEQEERRLAEQFALDEIDARETYAREYYQGLREFDRAHEEFRKDVEVWVCDTLQFSRESSPDSPHVFSYKARRGGGRSTLVPFDFLLNTVGGLLGRPGTYHRTLASNVPGLTLYRTGDPFIDAMEAYVQWDDRGRASAVWRVDRNWSSAEGEEWVGFRFHYVVEADIEPAVELLREADVQGFSSQSLRRRADAMLPPQFHSVWLGVDGEPVEDQRLAAILERPYRHPRDFGTDYNLHKHRAGMIDQVVDRALWEETCESARSQSEQLLRNERELRRQLDDRSRAADRQLERRLNQLEIRRQHLGSRSDGSDVSEALGRALIAGIRQPKLRVDSVSFFVVSGANPFDYERNEY